MPATTQPHSDALLKLDRLLKETKVAFLKEHEDLAQWMQDRNFQVEYLSFPKEEESTAQQAGQSIEAQFLSQLQAAQGKDMELARNISYEEYRSIIEKMKHLLQLPAGQLDQESALYLEQQLSDLLGFEVAHTLDSHQLLFATGIMQKAPHLKRSPTDSLEKHANYHEAELCQNRSAFGWFDTGSELSKQAIARETYYMSLPLYYLPDWSTQAQELKSWYKFRKMVVINPAEEVAVVCVVGDIAPNNYTKKQFAGSAELIHSGRIWSPLSSGKVLVLFVDDPNDTIELGPRSFTQIITQQL